MMQAFIIALRSEDIHTKHGAIIVENATHHPIGSGYNGIFRGAVVDATMTARPEKYSWMIHAEENAIANCTKNPLSLPHGANMYVTGTPCNACLQRIINFGIKRIYAAKRQGTLLEDDATQAHQQKILAMCGAEIIEIDLTNSWLKRVYLD
jgi:dCMP deaminase